MPQEKSLNPSFYLPTEPASLITVTGVGGMGCNFIDTLSRGKIAGLNLYAVNTDLQALDRCGDYGLVQIGKNRTNGRGAGGDPDMGRRSALDDADSLRQLLQGSEIVFVVAGMGGGTGTGAAPVIADLAREMGILVVGILTMPMHAEGKKRLRIADQGITAMRDTVDSLFVVSNENIVAIIEGEDGPVQEVFRRTDHILMQGVRGIAEIVTSRGYINLDLADVKNVLACRGPNASRQTLMGLGEALGDDRGRQAALAAIDNPLLKDISIKGAKSLLVNITGGPDMGYRETQQAISTIAETAGVDEQEIFLGIVVDEKMEGTIKVTVIAAGFTPAAAAKTTSEPKSPPQQLQLYRENNTGIHAGIQPGQTPTNRTPAWSEEWRTPAYLRREARRYENPERQPADRAGASAMEKIAVNQ